MKKLNSQHGFSSIALVLIVAVLLSIGFIGYHVYKSNNQVSHASNAGGNAAIKINNTKTTKNDDDTTIDETSLIKTAVTNYEKAQSVPEFSNIIVSHFNAQFALGEANDTSGDAGAEWFAQKTNGSWSVVSQGADGHCDELAAHGLTNWDANNCE